MSLAGSGAWAVIGVGNPDRGDDGVGPALVRHLAGRLPKQVAPIVCAGEAAALLARLERLEAAWLVDACRSGAEPGTIRRFDVAATPLPTLGGAWSSHGLGLAEALELARALGQLPPRCLVFAVEGQSFEAGSGLSPPVRAALEPLAVSLCAEIEGVAGSRNRRTGTPDFAPPRAIL